MSIQSLSISDFRNLVQVELKNCSPQLNLIYGENGSGKTSLLEAIYYLSYGKSFRQANSTRLIRHDQEKLALFAQIVNNDNQIIRIGADRNTEGIMRFKVSEKMMPSIVEMAYLLPIKTIHSQSHHLFELGPQYRRRFMDWGLFYQNQHFLEIWRKFERALKHRNVVLKEKKPQKELELWSDELLKYSLPLHQARETYLQGLIPLILQMIQNLLSITDVKIQYYPGWDHFESYVQSLKNNYFADYRRGITLNGPHRADLNFFIKDIPAKQVLSRGQQKLLICAMILAQGMMLTKETNKGVIYLVDDLPSELDFNSRKNLICQLSNQQAQIFITAIEKTSITELFSNENMKPTISMFHVEQGTLKDAQ